MQLTRGFEAFLLRATLLCSLFMTASGVQTEPPDGNNFQLVRITTVNEAQLELVRSLDGQDRGFEIWSDSLGIGTVEARILPEHKRRLEAVGIQCEVQIEDLQALHHQLFSTSRDAGFFEVYRTYDEHLAFMEDLVASYPDLAELVNLGSSVLGRPLWALRITGPGEDKPGVMYHGAQHGNEIMGACVIPYVAEFLLTNYGQDAEVTILVDNIEWFLLPIMNPDGYESGNRCNAHGADLNRNWGGPGCGSNPFSEPETAAMRDFFLEHSNVRAYIDFHTYSEVIIWPWGHTAEHCPDHDTFAAIAQPMHDRIFAVRGSYYDMGTACEVMYPVNGCSLNYTYGELGIWAFTFELGYDHSMPPWEILPTCQEMWGAMTFLSSWVGDCNDNGVSDGFDIADGTSEDCNSNGVPDECENTTADCNDNGIWDPCDIAEGTSEDCTGNWIPDECEPDCNDNGIADSCDILDGTSEDCNSNGVPDECDLQSGTSPDCNFNSVPDECDIASGYSLDCNGNGVPEECEPPPVLSRRYVDADTSPTGDGSSWANAFSELHTAMCFAQVDAAATEIWVAQGTYSPAPPGGDRTAAFALPSGVAVYGGFAGWETSLAQRDWETNLTVLSGDLDGNDVPEDFPAGSSFADNSYHVVIAYCVDATTVLDGFTITGGSAMGFDAGQNEGGGIYNDEGSPTLRNLSIVRNAARNFGGGMHNSYHCDPVLRNCVFSGNQALSYNGGGMFNDYLCSPVLTSCVFSDNQASHYGGGVYSLVDCDPVFGNCVFSANEASRDGVGVYSMSNCDPVFRNCLFSGNVAEEGGAMYYRYECLPVVTGCTFAGNSADHGNALGVYHWSNSVELSNCILWDGGDEVWSDDGASIVITYSDVEGGWSGNGNIDSDPLFADPDGADGIPGTEDDDLHLTPGSPCMNSGDPGFVPDEGETDLDGHARILCGQVDMGAYESGTGDYDCDEHVELDDFAKWSHCMGGPNTPPRAAGCEPCDHDHDGDVDLDDYATFQQSFTGPQP